MVRGDEGLCVDRSTLEDEVAKARECKLRIRVNHTELQKGSRLEISDGDLVEIGRFTEESTPGPVWVWDHRELHAKRCAVTEAQRTLKERREWIFEDQEGSSGITGGAGASCGATGSVPSRASRTQTPKTSAGTAIECGAAAQRLMRGFQSERARWTEDQEILQRQLGGIIGDCVLAAAFLCHLGPLNLEFRTRVLFDIRKTDLVEGSVAVAANFNLGLFANCIPGFWNEIPIFPDVGNR
jgi:hypothetical protein